MPLFFWIVIALAGIMLAALIVVLVAEINSQRSKTMPGRKESPAKQTARKSVPPTVSTPEKATVAERDKAAPEPPAAEIIISAEPDVLAVEIPEPEESAAGETATVEAEEPEDIQSLESVEIEPEAIPEILPEEEAFAETAFEPTPYPEFSNARAVEELGLSQEEADLFIGELVTQMEEEMPGLEAAVDTNNAEKVEKISHMLKGSATNLGTGGVSDVLVAFNTYVKTGRDPEVIRRHMHDLHFYFEALKARFGA